MLEKSKGIVLRKHKYSESSVIVRCYTEVFGLQSFIVSGIRSRKSAMKAALFQPFTLLDLVFYRKEKSTLHRLKEAKISFPLNELPYDPAKQAMSFFLSELIHKSLEEDEPEVDLFTFLEQTVLVLDQCERCPTSFHLWFMLQFCRFLGFAPQEEGRGKLFDLREGEFTDFRPHHGEFLDESQAGSIRALLGMNFDELTALKWAKAQRKELLEKIVLYYRIHLENFSGLKSGTVLEAVGG